MHLWKVDRLLVVNESSKPRTQILLLAKRAMITAELKSGIRNIQFALSYEVRERGGTITGDSFVWSYSAANDRPPEIVSARIISEAKMGCLVLPRECCEDSAIAIGRTEVWAAIVDCAKALTE